MENDSFFRPALFEGLWVLYELSKGRVTDEVFQEWGIEVLVVEELEGEAYFIPPGTISPDQRALIVLSRQTPRELQEMQKLHELAHWYFWKHDLIDPASSSDKTSLEVEGLCDCYALASLLHRNGLLTLTQETAQDFFSSFVASFVQAGNHNHLFASLLAQATTNKDVPIEIGILIQLLNVH